MSLERTMTDHARILSAHNNAIEGLEKDRQERAVLAAREEERDKATENWRKTIQEEVKEVKAVVKGMETSLNGFAWKVLGIVGTPVLVGLVGWLTWSRLPG